MLFNKKDTPESVKAAGLAKWYGGLSDQNRVRLGRYTDKVSVDKPVGFFLEVSRAAVADENWAFAVFLVEQAYRFNPDDLDSFLLNEELIEAYFRDGRYDDALAACEANMALFPKVSGRVGGAAGNHRFRSRQIDVLVGVMGEYDRSLELLEEYVEMGAMPEDELAYRLNSIKIHRMQRCFDGIYSYKYKDGSEQ